MIVFGGLMGLKIKVTTYLNNGEGYTGKPLTSLSGSSFNNSNISAPGDSTPPRSPGPQFSFHTKCNDGVRK